MQLDINTEGTFLFPPSGYSDANVYVKFWSDVPITDGVLSNITVGYAEFIRKESIAAGVRWGIQYDRENDKELHSKNPAREAAADIARQAAYDVFIDNWHETRPRRIRADYARAIARAGQLYYYSAALSNDDQDKVLGSTIALGSRQMTVNEIEDTFQLREIRPHFQDPEVTSSERLEDLRVEMQRLRGLV